MKKQWTQKILKLAGLFSVVSSLAVAQVKQATSSQLQCKTKAKEVAKIAYDDCMESAKGNEAERIRTEYKLKMAKLKELYEQKLKKLNIKLKQNTASQTQSEANSLPVKTETVVPAAETIAPAISSSRISPTEPSTPIEPPANTEEPIEPIIRLKPANPGFEQQQNLDSPPELSI